MICRLLSTNWRCLGSDMQRSTRAEHDRLQHLSQDSGCGGVDASGRSAGPLEEGGSRAQKPARLRENRRPLLSKSTGATRLS